ncbi:DEAD/DEAH box helicase family protein [Terriglobus sp. ADX1]|uniref:DEAD/DEAH box helicase family protein n=1 Tax=Terriglobus sp. ADX1 TaxID=2794063 RepID=UPI002FE6A351
MSFCLNGYACAACGGFPEGGCRWAVYGDGLLSFNQCTERIAVVDFSKKVGKSLTAKQLEPTKIYDSLDRASDKGPLRPAQESILADWHASRRADRDLVVKLQTGQGKTLIGLLMLQSKLNEGRGPAAFLCADRFLVQQTQKQAREFGFKNIVDEPDSEEFSSGRSILINTVDKLFNGISRFGTRAQSVDVGTILLDDAHACADSIRQAFTISLPRGHDCYTAILDLFIDDLEVQGPGTLADIKNGNFDAFLPIPYWSWKEKVADVTRFLARKTDDNKIKFPWALIKDELPECQCVISGFGLEIAPRLPLLEVFGSYWRAKHRIFMSATITNDAFLVKGLNIAPKAISQPLTYSAEKWYGEKMILIPSSADEGLTRDRIVDHFAKPGARRTGGVVALTPSFKAQSNWAARGAEAVDRNTINSGIQRLYNRDFVKTLALANKYDGIDLPDDTCRILIIDSKPFSEGLLDRYQDSCRPLSESTLLKEARTIEQGIGRGVRGQRDYCVVVLIGASLIRAMRTGQSKLNFSEMTHKQIEIGIAIADLARDEIAEGVDPLSALDSLVKQCLTRDEGWKSFYSQEMESVAVNPTQPALLDMFAAELTAEHAYRDGEPERAIEELQKLIDKFIPADSKDDRGWYVQDMARYKHAVSATEANLLQIKAHKMNHSLMRPQSGMVIEQLKVHQKRVEEVRSWLKSFESNEAMMLAAEEITTKLSFGTQADKFEDGVHQLGIALGFSSQRPDKDWRSGPDNLWALRDGHYLLIECKSEVDLGREAIYKTETGQMNNACAWFKQNYPAAVAKKVMIIPSKQLGEGAGFTESVQIMRRPNLKRLTTSFKAFCSEFKQLDLHSLSDSKIQQILEQHRLAIDNILNDYYEEPLNP